MHESKTAHPSPLTEETATKGVISAKGQPPRELTGWRKREHHGSWQSEGTGHKIRKPHRTGCFFTEKQTWLTSNTIYSQNNSTFPDSVDNFILLETSALAGKSELAGRLPSLSEQVLAPWEQRDLKESQTQWGGILFVLFQAPTHENKWWSSVTSCDKKGDKDMQPVPALPPPFVYYRSKPSPLASFVFVF